VDPERRLAEGFVAWDILVALRGKDEFIARFNREFARLRNLRTDLLKKMRHIYHFLNHNFRRTPQRSNGFQA
jgi:hypothetical protein